MASERKQAQMIARLVREAMPRRAIIDIDGLGSFRPDGESGYLFYSRNWPRVFIAYVHEDAFEAERLFDAFAANGFDPWLDRRKLLPGQNWTRSIEDAMETADFVVPCFSTHSVEKKGGFQSEVRHALDCARKIPLDEVFLVPVRLNQCRLPTRIAREVQYVDLFPDWDVGMERVLRVLRAQVRRNKAA
jgi:hypothetical protein